MNPPGAIPAPAPAPSTSGPNDRTVYVGNVGRDVDEQTLHMLFVHCGQVTQIRIAGDPTYETRFAFVEFSAPDQAQTACLLDGMQVFDRNIKVSMARGGGSGGGGGGGSSSASAVAKSSDPERVTRTIHVGGIPMDAISEEQLADYFKHVGEVIAVRKSGRFAWVEFESVKSANQALSLDGETLGNSSLRISQSKTPIHTAGWRRGGAGPGPVGGSAGMRGGAGAPPPMVPYPPPMAGAPPGYGPPPPAFPGGPVPYMPTPQPGAWGPTPPGPPPHGPGYGMPPPGAGPPPGAPPPPFNGGLPQYGGPHPGQLGGGPHHPHMPGGMPSAGPHGHGFPPHGPPGGY